MDITQLSAYSFISLTIYRYLEKKLGSKYTCEELLDTLKAIQKKSKGRE